MDTSAFLQSLKTEDIEFHIKDINSRYGDQYLRVARRKDGDHYWGVTERRFDYADDTICFIPVEELEAELDLRN
jgi:hypothetical protein